VIANVYHNGKHDRLRVDTADLENLIYRSGWTVTHDIENITPEARAEIERLETLDFIGPEDSGGIAWWNARLVSSEPCLTPDQ